MKTGNVLKSLGNLSVTSPVVPVFEHRIQLDLVQNLTSMIPNQGNLDGMLGNGCTVEPPSYRLAGYAVNGFYIPWAQPCNFCPRSSYIRTYNRHVNPIRKRGFTVSNTMTSLQFQELAGLPERDFFRTRQTWRGAFPQPTARDKVGYHYAVSDVIEFLTNVINERKAEHLAALAELDAKACKLATVQQAAA